MINALYETMPDLPKDATVCLYCKTNGGEGFIYIYKQNDSFLGLKAKDHTGKLIAEAKPNETGLRWLKKEVRGWHQWTRHNWKITWTTDFKIFNS